jgi:hypothetical protein
MEKRKTPCPYLESIPDSSAVQSTVKSLYRATPDNSHIKDAWNQGLVLISLKQVTVVGLLITLVHISMYSTVGGSKNVCCPTSLIFRGLGKNVLASDQWFKWVPTLPTHNIAFLRPDRRFVTVSRKNIPFHLPNGSLHTHVTYLAQKCRSCRFRMI